MRSSTLNILNTSNVQQSGPLQDIEFPPHDPKEDVLVKVLFTVMWGGSREQATDGGHPEMNNTLRLRGHVEESQPIAGIVQEGWLGSFKRDKAANKDTLSKQRGIGKKYSDQFLLPVSLICPIQQQPTWLTQEMQSLVINLLEHRQGKAKNGFGRGTRQRRGNADYPVSSGSFSILIQTLSEA